MEIQTSISKYMDTEQLQTDIKECATAHSFIFEKIEIHHLEKPMEHRFVFHEPGKTTLHVVGNASAFESFEIVSLTYDEFRLTVKTPVDLPTEFVGIYENDSLIAYYDKPNATLYLPFELPLNTDLVQALYAHILNLFYSQCAPKFIDKESWTDNAEELKEDIIKTLSRNTERKIQEAKQFIKRTNDEIDTYRQRLHKQIELRLTYLKELDTLNNPDEKFFNNFFTSLDQIRNHPGVREVKIKRDYLHIEVDNVYCYAELSGVEKRFYIGNMRIELNYMRPDTRFYGDNPRQSCWSERDPHPHVDGHGGHPCLGNAESSLIELIAQKEMYAAFLVCLDFLENANTADVAGAKIVHWDEVDEEGNIIRKGGARPTRLCHLCEESYVIEDEEFHAVATGINHDGEVSDSRDWCDDCFDSEAIFNDHVGRYVDEDTANAIAQYFERENEAEEDEPEAEEESGDEAEEDLFPVYLISPNDDQTIIQEEWPRSRSGETVYSETYQAYFTEEAHVLITTPARPRGILEPIATTDLLD